MAQQSEAGRTEQIVSQFLLKALHAILAARVPHLRHHQSHPSHASQRTRKRDKWFNLALGDLPPALEPWQHGVLDPVIVDVILTPRDASDAVAGIHETVLERWTVQCEQPHSSPWIAAAAPPSPETPGSSRRAYKKSIVLLRSLYSVLRFLPAYRVFRMLCSSNQSYNYDISYKFSSFAEPFSREEEEELKPYSFIPPVETQLGQLSVSVLYRPDLSEFNLQLSSLVPPMIIPDYVGSPAADPMRAFPASPAERGARPISFPLRGVRPSGDPSLARPHSWTGGPMVHRPHSTSSASDSRPSPTDSYFHRSPSQPLTAHRKSSFSFDEFGLSPPFSLSPTPSPPAHSGNSLQSRLRSETAPVSIPFPVTGKSQLYRTQNLSDPTRISLPPMSPRSVRVDPSSHDSTSDSSRSFKKLEGLRVADLYPNLNLYAAQKSLKDGKDDSGRFSGVFSSGGSPRFGFSRSSSRLSIQDDLDDGDFSCPFAVDDVYPSDSQTRTLDEKEAPDSARSFMSPRKSQDAAVGVLVHMLKTAQPLRQDSYMPESSKSELKTDGSTSSFFTSRKASDALEELRSYREMKEMLLSQSGTRLSESVKRKPK